MILSPVSVAYEGQTVILSSIVVPAGFPSPASDDLEDEIDPIAWIVPHPSATFWWRVSGDSLVDEGIHDGDLIAVDRSGKAGTVAKLAMRQPFVLFKGLTFQKLCLP
ncbi:LexA family protein, partial [Klebsiella pneumoniae]